MNGLRQNGSVDAIRTSGQQVASLSQTNGQAFSPTKNCDTTSDADEITTIVDELQLSIRLLIDSPGKVTINHGEYRRFYDKIQGFVGRYNLVNTAEWADVNRWLITKPNEHLTLAEAGNLKLALEHLRMKAIKEKVGCLTEIDTVVSKARIEEGFHNLDSIGQEQLLFLKEQIDILQKGNKSARLWNWVMFIVALSGIIIALLK